MRRLECPPRSAAPALDSPRTFSPPNRETKRPSLSGEGRPFLFPRVPSIAPGTSPLRAGSCQPLRIDLRSRWVGAETQPTGACPGLHPGSPDVLNFGVMRRKQSGITEQQRLAAKRTDALLRIAGNGGRWSATASAEVHGGKDDISAVSAARGGWAFRSRRAVREHLPRSPGRWTGHRRAHEALS
jgi:hypothetical protein